MPGARHDNQNNIKQLQGEPPELSYFSLMLLTLMLVHPWAPWCCLKLA